MLDSRVARLNIDIDSDRDWPDPYHISTLIRKILCLITNVVYPIQKCWTGARKAFPILKRSVLKFDRRPSAQCQVLDEMEMGEGGNRLHELEARSLPQDEQTPKFEAEECKFQYRSSLQRKFGETSLVGLVMFGISSWEDGK